MWWCSVVTSHSGSVPGRQGCRSGQPPYRMTPRGEQCSSIPCFPIECWSWLQRKSEYVTKLCSTFCTAFFITAKLQRVGHPWNFRGRTIAPLCSRTGLVGPVLKGSWWLYWWNRRYGPHLVVQNPSLFMTMQGVTPLLLSQTSCAADNRRFWNIHCTHPMWIHAITISSPKWKSHYEGPGWRQEKNLSLL